MKFDPEKITFFAKTDARGQQIPFGIKAKDRQRHMYVIGKTGMGKSTLLENMAAQDIQNGEGMAFIDPHGSAAETLLDYIPEHRLDDVVYFAPFDLANPISFNVMEDVDPDKRHLVVSGLMATFKKIWVDAWSARMEYILTNALLALIEYPDTTLLSVNRMFTDKEFRNRVVDYVKDPAVKAYWKEEFAGYTERFAAEALPAIQNKVGQFTGNPLIRNIIGQPHSSFDIRKIMDEKKILIMNLSKGLVGETNANLLGSMLTTRIYLAAMSRADLPVAQMKQMPNFYFYVDEFQSFANATFANILSEARKYHLNLIIAHQYIEQMEEDVRNAVFGNVGTTISFRVGPFDAEVLETVFSPRFLAPDLVNLGFAQIYLTLMIDGIGSQPFSAVTLPPIATPHISYKDMAIAASRRNYTKPREEVEKIVLDLHTPVKKLNTETVQKHNAENAEKRQKENQNKNFNNGNSGNGAFGKNNNNQRPSNFSNNKVENNVFVKTPVFEPVPVVPKPEIKEEKTDKPKFENNNKQEVKAAPKSSEKTLEDLRQVLARISQKENKSEEVSENKIEQNNSHSQKPQPKQFGQRNPESKQPEKTSDLKNALAEILKKVEPAPEKMNEESAKVDQKNVKSDKEIPSVEVAKDDAKLELQKMMEETEAALADLEKTQNNNGNNVDDPLAVRKIEKLFKDSNNHRSPFAS
jgi:hypothetical protein